MCSKVLNGHIILTDTSITTILAPEMTYTPHFFISKGSFFPMDADQLQMEAEIALVGYVDWNMARDCDTQVALQVFDGGVVEFVRER